MVLAEFQPQNVIKCITVIHHAQCNILLLHITIMYVNLNLKIIFWCVCVCVCVCM